VQAVGALGNLRIDFNGQIGDEFRADDLFFLKTAVKCKKLHSFQQDRPHISFFQGSKLPIYRSPGRQFFKL